MSGATARGATCMNSSTQPIDSTRPLDSTQPTDSTQPIDDVNTRWLLRMRWIAYLSVLLLVAALPQLARVEFNQRLALLVVGVGLLSNAAASACRSRAHMLRSAVTLTLTDLSLLTALLAATGGPASPLVLGYVLILVVASVIVSRRQLWLLCGLAGAALLLSIFVHSGLEPDHSHSGNDLDHHPGHTSPSPSEHLWLHVRPLWLATVVLVVLVIYVVRWAFEQRESELHALRHELGKNARLAELWTLAASAAHELGTPLATISVIATELRRRAHSSGWGARADQDLTAICEQLERCRTVLDNMTNDARSTGREPSVEVALERFVADARESATDPRRIDCDVPREDGASLARIPRRLLLSVVQNLLDNALDAAPERQVSLRARSDAASWWVDISDDGRGLSTADLRRVGRETFSNKSNGMGVGLFLGRAILDRLGGSLHFSSGPSGTTVRLTVPRSVPASTSTTLSASASASA